LPCRLAQLAHGLAEAQIACEESIQNSDQACQRWHILRSQFRFYGRNRGPQLFRRLSQFCLGIPCFHKRHVVLIEDTCGIPICFIQRFCDQPISLGLIRTRRQLFVEFVLGDPHPVQGISQGPCYLSDADSLVGCLDQALNWDGVSKSAKNTSRDVSPVDNISLVVNDLSQQLGCFNSCIRVPQDLIKSVVGLPGAVSTHPRVFVGGIQLSHGRAELLGRLIHVPDGGDHIPHRGNQGLDAA